MGRGMRGLLWTALGGLFLCCLGMGRARSQGVAWPDADLDGKVGDAELLDYIDEWAGGAVGDFDLLIAVDWWAGKPPTGTVQLSASLPPLPSPPYYGFGYGPFRNSQRPGSAPYLTPAQVEADLPVVVGVTRRVRTYGASGIWTEVTRILTGHDIEVLQGIWLGPEAEPEGLAANNREIADGVALARQHPHLRAVVVGNEVLLRRDLTLEQLIRRIEEVKGQVDTPIATAETWDQWVSAIDLAGHVDLVLVHVYAYWEGRSIEEAVQYTLDTFHLTKDRIHASHPGKEVIIGEVGWPSAGLPLGAALPSPGSQRRFFEEFTRRAAQEGVAYYYFSLIDEPWKGGDVLITRGPPDGEGYWKVGGHWGIYNTDRSLKGALKGLAPQTAAQIYTAGELSARYGVGVSSSGGHAGWVSKARDHLRFAYPAGQDRGEVRFTVGPANTATRWSLDFSAFDRLVLELRGSSGGERIQVVVKDRDAANDSQEEARAVWIGPLTTNWQRVTVPLLAFRGVSDLKELHAVPEIIFTGTHGQTVDCRRILFEPRVP